MRRRRLLNASAPAAADDSTTGRLLNASAPPPPRAAADSTTGRLLNAPPPPPPRVAADSTTGRLLNAPPPPPRAADDYSMGRLLVHAPPTPLQAPDDSSTGRLLNASAPPPPPQASNDFSTGSLLGHASAPPTPPRAAYYRSPLSSEGRIDKEGTSTSANERDMIQVSINEHYEIESVGRGVVGLHLRGIMDVTFPPNSDRFVQFELMKLGDLKLRPHPFVDKDLLTNFECVKPQTPERPFYTDHCGLLKWHQREFRIPPPPMIKVTGYPALNLAEQGGVVRNIIDIGYKYQAPTPLLDLVFKIPIPHVDITGQPRRLVRTRAWHNIGSHIETEDFVEWQIGSVNESNRSGDFTMDFCYDAGSFDIRQFYPVEASFTYTDCRALTVARVRASDGSLLKFQQTALGNCRYVYDPYLVERRAAKRQAELRAWKNKPWDDV